MKQMTKKMTIDEHNFYIEVFYFLDEPEHNRFRKKNTQKISFTYTTNLILSFFFSVKWKCSLLMHLSFGHEMNFEIKSEC